MRENKRKQIAVAMCGITFENQRKMLEGMIDAISETDHNLYIFTNYISMREKLVNIEGAYHIMYLPDFREFDGAIIMKNSLQYLPVADYVTNAMMESKIPMVSIDIEMEGASWLGISSYDAEWEMVEHLVVEHNCRNIYCIAGPKNHHESQRRFEAYCDVLKKYDLPYNEEHVYHGFFDINSGELAVEQFLENGECPEAIVCANDDMAIGAMGVLKKRGYRIPEDIKVVGFDNCRLAELHCPSLTSVNKRQHEVGYKAVYEVLDRIAGQPPKKQCVECNLELRESCGCTAEKYSDLEGLKEAYVEDHFITQHAADCLRNMMADFSGMERPSELVEALKRYIQQINAKTFYLCLCDEEQVFARPDDNMTGQLDIEKMNSDYTEKIAIPLAYEDGEFKSYGEFSKGMVLPEVCREASGGNYYIVTPINYQKLCYGYAVSGNCSFPMESVLYYSWLMSIGTGLENIRKWKLLKDTVVKLNGLWAYDMMTHLYNRAGFFHNVKPLLQEMKDNDRIAFVLFMDMDGLKNVNDTLGHEIGDWMIREIAEVVKQHLKDNQIAMRYGGDEFVIFGQCENEEQMQQLPEMLRKTMQIRNQRNGYLFKLSASIGISQYRARDIVNLDTLMEQADMKMYEEKKMKKMLKEKNT